ncbi:AP2 family protein [Babesia ovis]|uniref:AP2 family protein n=1 Tax=Babesia ovis TaxID=5869 RepID=A0A9W5T8N3_BABOV|nr:AP2 family protein [Babesia ovis]
MEETSQIEAPYTSPDSGIEPSTSSLVEGVENYGYEGEQKEVIGSEVTLDHSEHAKSHEGVEYAVPEPNAQHLYNNGANGYQSAEGHPHPGSYQEQAWHNASYMGIPQEALQYNTDISHESHMGYATPGYDMTNTMVGSYAGVVSDNSLQSGEGAHMHSKLMDGNQHDMMQAHGMPHKLDQDGGDAPRRVISKGRKNKDEANELVRRAKLLPKVMGVRYDANHQYWVATWYQNRKRMDRYFSVGRFGFEEARMLAIDCRKTAGKSLQGKSYDRPQYSSKDMPSKSRNSYDGDGAHDKNADYYGGSDNSKKTKDFNRLNVSKVALNYILSDLCNNCLPSILENNHMPGELYIHCYNKISDHLQMIITANQSEEIEKYLHLFQLCIQNRVLPSALQVQEQRAMITTLCQM